MNAVAIIPARGGSKRIPRKNIRTFAGLPIIAYSIRAAKAADLFTRVIVSTDDEEISTVANEQGAEAPFRRPVELADDFATTDAVLLHALEWLWSEGTQFDYFCCIYPTAPFVTPADLENGLKVLQQTDATTAVSVSVYPSTIFRALKITKDDRLEMFWPEHRDRRSQDFETAWHDAGQFYWGHAAKFARERHLFGENTVAIPLSRSRVQDIDTAEDWQRAEKMYAVLQNR